MIFLDIYLEFRSGNLSNANLQGISENRMVPSTRTGRGLLRVKNLLQTYPPHPNLLPPRGRRSKTRLLPEGGGLSESLSGTLNLETFELGLKLGCDASQFLAQTVTLFRIANSLLG